MTTGRPRENHDTVTVSPERRQGTFGPDVRDEDAADRLQDIKADFDIDRQWAEVPSGMVASVRSAPSRTAVTMFAPVRFAFPR